jgi:hypothetical protein
MAKTKKNQDLFDRLRANGVRKRVANVIADGADKGRKKAPKEVREAVSGLRDLVGELEDRVQGGPAKRKAAAKKAARTRKAKSARRSAAAKKGARTRAKA